jgi:hypothetical protein
MTRSESRSAHHYSRIAWTVTVLAWVLAAGIGGTAMLTVERFDVHVVMLAAVILFQVTSLAVSVHVLERIMPSIAARAFAAAVDLGPRAPADGPSLNGQDSVRRLHQS